MRVVSPYRALRPESGAHQALGPFDWVGALGMLRASVARSCDCETVALTDETTDVGPGSVFRYPASTSRLMLWILEVSLQYVSSPDFDRDTVFVSPDSLIVGDLWPYFAGDLTILVRHGIKYRRKPILNAVQWWPVASRDRLVDFYTAAVAGAAALAPAYHKWGADSEALRQLIEPLRPGIHRRAGLDVSMREASTALVTISNVTIRQLALSKRVVVPAGIPIVDFKGLRKRWMPQYFAAAGLASCA